MTTRIVKGGKGRVDDDELLKMLYNRVSQKDIAKFFGVSSSAITYRKQYLKEKRPKELSTALRMLPDSVQKLAPGKRRFAIAKAGGLTKTEAAKESFNCGTNHDATNIGIQLSKEPDIELAITDLLAQEGLSRRTRIQTLKNHVESINPDTSLKALDQTFKLENLYKSGEVTSLNFSFTQLIVQADKEALTELKEEKLVENNPNGK